MFVAITGPYLGGGQGGEEIFSPLIVLHNSTGANY